MTAGLSQEETRRVCAMLCCLVGTAEGENFDWKDREVTKERTGGWAAARRRWRGP